MKSSCIITDEISGAVADAVAQSLHSLSTSLWVHLLSPADRALCTALVVPLKQVYSIFLVVALAKVEFLK